MELTGILGSVSGYINLYVFLEAFLPKEEINIQHKEVRSKQKMLFKPNKILPQFTKWENNIWTSVS